MRQFQSTTRPSSVPPSKPRRSSSTLDKLESQTGMRTDPWKMKYYDELTKIDPVVDNPVRAPMTNIDDNSRIKTDEEMEDDFVKFINEIPEPKHENDFDESLWEKFDKDLRMTVGREEAERNPPTALAPDLPKVAEPKPPPKKDRKGGQEQKRDNKVVSPALMQLMQMTGYNEQEIAKLRVKTVISHRVVNQTRLGKIQKMYMLSVAGNGQGLIGVGEGKSAEGSQALLQSQYRAIRNMAPILRYENRTIYGDLSAKVSATELELFARPPGMLSLPSVLKACELTVLQASDSAVNSTSGRSADAPAFTTSPLA